MTNTTKAASVQVLEFIREHVTTPLSKFRGDAWVAEIEQYDPTKGHVSYPREEVERTELAGSQIHVLRSKWTRKTFARIQFIRFDEFAPGPEAPTVRSRETNLEVRVDPKEHEDEVRKHINPTRSLFHPSGIDQAYGHLYKHCTHWVERWFRAAMNLLVTVFDLAKPVLLALAAYKLYGMVIE